MPVVSHSMCNLCENPHPYQCPECNDVGDTAEQSDSFWIAKAQEARQSGFVSPERAEALVQGSINISPPAHTQLGLAARVPQIVRTWIGSGEDAAEFQRNMERLGST